MDTEQPKQPIDAYTSALSGEGATESEASHTPGPWSVVGSDDDPCGDITVKASARSVCRLWLDDAPVPDYNAAQWANARLIAAAPQMLFALQGLHDDIAEYSRINHLGGFDNHWMKAARAAIAAATGSAS
jgi:hypothetical protein